MITYYSSLTYLMQKLFTFPSQYDELTRAFKQAPWRVQIQWLATAAALVVVLIAIGGMYLAEASRTATAGRDVQALQAQKAELEMAINRQRSLIAQMKSVGRLERRARELGYVPALAAQVEFIVVDGYRPVTAVTPQPVGSVTPVEVVDYNETLGSWLARTLSTMLGVGG